MSPMEECIYMHIKKGYNTPEKLSKKVGKAMNYICVYARQLRGLGFITTTCPTCNRTPYYTIVS